MRLRIWLLDVVPFAVVITFLFIIAMPRVGGWVGDWHPAAAPMQLTDAVKVGNVIKFSGSSARLWGACRPLRLEWHLGTREGHNVPVVVNWGPPIKRKEGKFDFKGWTAEMTDVETFKFGTHSDVIHSCRIFASYDPILDEWIGGFVLPFDIKTRFYR